MFDRINRFIVRGLFRPRPIHHFQPIPGGPIVVVEGSLLGSDASRMVGVIEPRYGPMGNDTDQREG